MPAAPSRLSDYPFVIVRVGCQFCPRSGAYRLAMLMGSNPRRPDESLPQGVRTLVLLTVIARLLLAIGIVVAVQRFV
jgi:hypothetical protein